MLPPAIEPSATWDYMLPGPPSKNNGGSADLSAAGLLAYAAGSSVAVVDTHSMQLVATLPLPPPPSTAASPFITAVRWSPLALPHHLAESDNSSPHLVLAVGDRHGRISLLDFRSRAPILFFDTNYPNSSKLGIQDLCWIQTRLDSWSLAAVSGSSLLSIYNTTTGRCFFKYDASPEFFSCLRRDPFDSRHFCALGLKGFLLSVKLLGDDSENDVVLRELQIRTDTSELQRLERDSSGGSNNGAPASSVFPNYVVKFAFSPHWKHVILLGFPRELVLFDLQYESVLFAGGFPRGCGKFLEVLPDANMEVFYCAHLDGKLSTWQRKEGEQVHIMCSMDELMPSIGTTVPSPLVLAVAISQSDYNLQDIRKLCPDTDSFDMNFDQSFDFLDEASVISKTHLISISDDGKVWKWLLTAEGPRDGQKDREKVMKVDEVCEILIRDIESKPEVVSDDEHAKETVTYLNDTNSIENCQSSPTVVADEVSFKMNLVGEVHLLSSALSMLAVPSPSLTAILARGGNSPAIAVPLVALGTQSGTIDVVDISANAVAASFSVHSNVVRGLRWLGNSRLVSFSYTQVTEKTGGYVNRLVVTCLRSGLNRTFRVLQKPERAPVRVLRTSSSGRYLLIMFRDAPVEVWAMTKTPMMLRSLALPFTVLEWTLPTVPRPAQKPSRSSSFLSKERDGIPPTGTSSPTKSSSTDAKGADGSQDEFSESFAFALVNGAVGVFEVHGRRIRDFRPKWPSSSFVSSDGLITAMAYRLPHVVMGDRSGSIRWWDVTTGQSSSFNTHRDGIRRIKFSPVVPGDRSRGRIAVLFYDNTCSVFDLDSSDPLANSLLQPQFPGTLVLELDWLPLRTNKDDPLILCIAGADSSFRLVELNANEQKLGDFGPQARPMKERFRPVPLPSPVLLPASHALALRMILQFGVKPSWFHAFSSTTNEAYSHIPGTPSAGDLRGYMIDSPCIGDSAVPEMLLKVLEPYRKEGCLLDDERVRLYAKVVNRGSTLRLAFAAAIFGESMETLFWLQLPLALNHFMNKISSKGKSVPGSGKKNVLVNGQLKLMAFEQQELWECANERIQWHEKLEGEEAIQNRVHELVSVGNLEAAVSLLLSTSPESPYFYANALRAVALASAVSSSLLELAVKVVAANMVRNDRSMSGTHLLCAVGRYQEACSQLQDAGCWTDAATLAATHLKGSDYARVLQRWAEHVLHAEHNIWRALILYVAAGALQEALAALRQAQLPDTAAMFILVCREIHSEFLCRLDSDEEAASLKEKVMNLPGLNPVNEDVVAVGEYYGQYQRKLVHLCMDSQPYTD
ncbi:WD repeat-containing protein 11 [Phtheirospermum japonicum]|uniref:WD repeat-containing protein 11 n=1 Tax=Phtheirospermum japonicum TaxID=374723 RepID=A0A830DB10_9LAMI|nr:WD repeat-containing protein 11 [Phtheirospermum japonicum]